jgi:hypothetical protein
MRGIARLVLAIGIALLASDAAQACKCRLVPADELLNGSEAIFEGVALSTKPAGGRNAVTAFRVVTGYKGASRGQSVRVRHFTGPSAACGVHFERGKRHLIAASREAGGALAASACTLASMRSDAGKELVERLGR